ncbi:dCTP deaminase domain-containing protein [Clostridium diolis]|uniref:dCTP deaminase domain-containing protein n=1 Tax=Clostridium diolis TaxID=223919 RepID=UPI003AF8D856
MSIIIKKETIKNYFCKDNEDKDFKEWEKNYNDWSYDLRLGNEAFITSQECPKILKDSDPYITIKPGEFGLLITHERLQVPCDVMGFISVKFTYKKKGLINISGFHVDPRYEGKIIFSVYNAGPSDILLKYREPVFMIFFEKIGDEKSESDRKNCERCGKDFKEGCKIIKGYDHIPASMVSEIRGQSVSLANNNQKIERLEDQLKLYGGIAIGLILTLFGILIKVVL